MFSIIKSIVPNFLTVLRVILSPLLYYFLKNSLYNTAVIVILIAAITDFLDGFLARKWNAVSDMGIIIDPIADKIFVFFLLLYFYLYNILPKWFFIITILKDTSIMIGGYIIYNKISYNATVINPVMIGKINTAMQFLLSLLLIINLSIKQSILHIPIRITFILTLITTIISWYMYIRRFIWNIKN